eukprot:5309275-Lingulodinium_polyedra.AAC.1
MGACSDPSQCPLLRLACNTRTRLLTPDGAHSNASAPAASARAHALVPAAPSRRAGHPSGEERKGV